MDRPIRHHRDSMPCHRPKARDRDRRPPHALDRAARTDAGRSALRAQTHHAPRCAVKEPQRALEPLLILRSRSRGCNVHQPTGVFCATIPCDLKLYTQKRLSGGYADNRFICSRALNSKRVLPVHSKTCCLGIFSDPTPLTPLVRGPCFLASRPTKINSRCPTVSKTPFGVTALQTSASHADRFKPAAAACGFLGRRPSGALASGTLVS